MRAGRFLFRGWSVSRLFVEELGFALEVEAGRDRVFRGVWEVLGGGGRVVDGTGFEVFFVVTGLDSRFM